MYAFVSKAGCHVAHLDLLYVIILFVLCSFCRLKIRRSLSGLCCCYLNIHFIYAPGHYLHLFADVVGQNNIDAPPLIKLLCKYVRKEEKSFQIGVRHFNDVSVFGPFCVYFSPPKSKISYTK